ncbi:MAG TPA: iron reductase [Bacillota bacterium]
MAFEVDNWMLIRLFGFLAFFLFTLSVFFGMASQLRICKKKIGLFMSIHLSAAWAGIFTLLVHMLLLLRDTFIPYTIGELIIPFQSSHEPIATALGIFAFYFLLIVMITSDFWMKRLGRKMWKKIHFLVFPSWLLMLIHSVWMGTDTSEPWAVAIYSSALALFVGFIFLRKMDQNALNRRKKH